MKRGEMYLRPKEQNLLSFKEEEKNTCGFVKWGGASSGEVLQ